MLGEPDYWAPLAIKTRNEKGEVVRAGRLEYRDALCLFRFIDKLEHMLHYEIVKLR